MSQDGKDKKGELGSFAYSLRGCKVEQSIGCIEMPKSPHTMSTELRTACAFDI